MGTTAAGRLTVAGAGRPLRHVRAGARFAGYVLPTTAAEVRAGQLLDSLLHPSERDQRARTGSFWVHTETGWFRFGTLYDIRYRAARWPWVERSICVVTEGFEDRPLADLWAELIVTARADPSALTGAANFRAEAPARLAGSTDPLRLRASVDELRRNHRALREARRELDAAYLAFDAGRRLARTCRPSWGAPFDRAAVRGVRAFAARHRDEQERIEVAHRVVFDTAGRAEDPLATVSP